MAKHAIRPIKTKDNFFISFSLSLVDFCLFFFPRLNQPAIAVTHYPRVAFSYADIVWRQKQRLVWRARLGQQLAIAEQHRFPCRS
jgi:hypothetical protein